MKVGATSLVTNPLTQVLATFRSRETTDWANAWVGMEPTFQTEKSIRKWWEMAEDKAGEDAYFASPFMLKPLKKVAKAIKKAYEARCAQGDHPACLFARVELKEDMDQWDVRRQNLLFHWPGENVEPFKVRFVLDPETFEYSIKPVPLVWFYDARFVDFLEEFLWRVPIACGMTPSIAHGGAQFSLSAKTFLGGCLLADDIATKLNHPELATWIMDWPNSDDRAFRATGPRREAFRKLLDQYWSGAFHPGALGVLRAENAYLDRGFGPALSSPFELMNHNGPLGEAWTVFQNNFAFARCVRLLGQNVHPGYWQASHPKEDGFRPDQIMRYSEGNLNRLQIAGEFHVKSAKVLDASRIPELDDRLELAHLTEEASWENRGQMGRTSARDFVEALLLDVHHAQYLQAHPHVRDRGSLVQDQLLADGEETLRRLGRQQTLDQLRKEARQHNLEYSHGRIKSDWIEPETLFWAAWHALPDGDKAALAHEVVAGFVERVEQAAAMDPRPEFRDDPMEWHRHRIHPVLWKALVNQPTGQPGDSVHRELTEWGAKRDVYLARRPVYSQVDQTPPWEIVR